MIEMTCVPVLTDNYVWILREPESGLVAAVDPGEARPVERALDALGYRLDFIFCTHHHGDHIGGNYALKGRYGCRIVGPAADAHRIPDMDMGVHEGHPLRFGDETIEVIETPGHTLGHVCFYLPRPNMVFTGDTLFAMGCGRLFEGTAEQMWHSLGKLAALPDDALVYCGHEYTQANGAFGLRIEPHNDALHRRMEEVRVIRKQGLATLPSTVGLEKETNVFLRAGSADRFAEIRKTKDAA